MGASRRRGPPPLPALLALLGILLVFPNSGTAAGSGGTWQVSTNGVVTQQGLQGSQFDGSCEFTLGSAGRSGSCALSMSIQSKVASFTCAIDVVISGWTPAKSTPPAFIVTSGQVTATAPSPTESKFCVTVSAPIGTINPLTGAVVAPIYTQMPLLPGSYVLGGIGALLGVAYLQVSFEPTS